MSLITNYSNISEFLKHNNRFTYHTYTGKLVDMYIHTVIHACVIHYMHILAIVHA